MSDVFYTTTSQLDFVLLISGIEKRKALQMESKKAADNPPDDLMNYMNPTGQALLAKLTAEQRRIALINLVDEIRAAAMMKAMQGAALDMDADVIEALVETSHHGRGLVDALKKSGLATVCTAAWSEACDRLASYGVATPKLWSPQDEIESLRCLSAKNRSQKSTAEIIVHLQDRRPTRPQPSRHHSEAILIHFDQLLLFSWNTGASVEGVVERFLLTEGGEVIIALNEMQGSLAATTFSVFCSVNLLPTELVALHFRGSTLRIYDPYVRVDARGEVIVHVDSIADVEVFIPAAQPPELADVIREARSNGDLHLEWEEPLTALGRCCDPLFPVRYGQEQHSVLSPVITLLANAAQCMLHLECYHEAMLTAAFVLLLQPDHAKANFRYKTALSFLQRSSEDGSFLLSMPKLDGGTQIPRVRFSRSKSTLSGRRSLVTSREAGNDFFSKSQWKEALTAYLSPLQTMSEHAERDDDSQEQWLHDLAGWISNICRCAVELRQWQLVLIAAPFAAFVKPSLHSRSSCHYATALAHLGLKDQAERILSDLPRDTTRSQVFLCVRQIANEKQKGNYDLRAISDSKATPLAEFAGPVAIQTTTGKGLGLFAKQSIPAGTLILASRPLTAGCCREDTFSSTMHLYGRTQLTARTRALQTEALQMCTTPLILQLFLRQAYHLCNYSPRTAGAQSKLEDDSWLRTPFTFSDAPLGVDIGRLTESMLLNAFSLNTTTVGMFLVPSLMNHDVLPNTSRISFQNMLFVRATRDISAGEEITTTYFDFMTAEAEASSQWRIPAVEVVPAIKGLVKNLRDKNQDFSRSQLEGFYAMIAPVFSHPNEPSKLRRIVGGATNTETIAITCSLLTALLLRYLTSSTSSSTFVRGTLRYLIVQGSPLRPDDMDSFRISPQKSCGNDIETQQLLHQALCLGYIPL